MKNQETRERLVNMLAHLFKKQDRTWDIKRGFVNRQINRVYDVCDRSGYHYRELLLEAEIQSRLI
ncbi:hypothetical protein NYE44_01520 [Paenibacillus sp. FSL L8-0493]|uniref:hypothetical protein n=1 Tax=Paenibacillus sp. FSL L8-0493 TaxID=2975333 RepID=UPI0030FD822A